MPCPQVETALVLFQDHELAWTRVDGILERSQSQDTKRLALNVLEKTIKFRWLALPQEQRNAIKQYVVEKIVSFSGDREVLQKHSAIVGHLNRVLVQVCSFPIMLSSPLPRLAAWS